MRTAALVVPLILLSGCVSGPDYAGGPSSDEPHGIVSPGDDVTIWAVDGYSTASRSFSIMIGPGTRKLKVRIEHPIESDDWKPYEVKTITLEVEAGVTYYLSRKEGESPPYELDIKTSKPRRRAPPPSDD